MLTDDQYRNNFCQNDRDMSWAGVAEEWNKLFLQGPEVVKVKKTEEGKLDVNTKDFWNKKYANIIENERAGGTFVGELGLHKVISKLLPEDGLIVDVGCDHGRLLQHLHDKYIGIGLTGIDISQTALDRAKQKVPVADFFLVDEKACDLPVNNVDVIVSLHTIEHLQKPEEYIKHWAKSLKEGGEIIIVVPLEDEYVEHVNVYNLGTCEELAKKVAPDYEIKSRTMSAAYVGGPKQGQFGKEAIIRLFY